MARSTRWVAALAAVLVSGGIAGQDQKGVDAVLGNAKLLETQGDLAAAEQALRTAVASATDATRPRLLSALRDLLRRQGRTEDADALAGATTAGADALPAGDPIQRLIATLDLGTYLNDAVA